MGQLINPDENIIERPLSDILSEKYLAYSLSTIMSRSLPDVRDGLKPVHRRLLYAMQQLRLSPNKSPKKSARVVGDVIGKFHPHGDQSVYDALVRLAQDFAVRYPLIDGQGNFGNIDGDNAAAMRYTEARLTAVADSMLTGIAEDAIDFRETYDGEGSEPVVLPGDFPNLLANGSSGIAVGMATNIPSHNVSEICDALVHLVDHKSATVDDLVDFVKGPDFPTGGVLVEPEESIRESYRTGKGSFRMRAKWEKEDLGQGQYQIVITEIPFQVQKSRLIEKIADLILSKKVTILEDVRDESAEDIRVVLEPKSRNIDPNILMEALFKQCDLESRFSLNMNVLDGGVVPKVMNLKEVLKAFLDHRREVLVRRSQHRLQKIIDRLELLEGYLIAYLNIDEVIKIIREEDEPKQVMMARFKLTDNQAEAILNMRLRSLRKLEEFEIRKEHDELTAEKGDIEQLLGSEARQWTQIKKQIKQIKQDFGDERRTRLEDAPEVIDIPEEALIEKEAITVVCSKKGWIRALKGHSVDAETVSYKDGDGAQFAIPTYTTDRILVLATDGRFYTLLGDNLPSGRGYGEPVRLMIDMPNDVDIVTMFAYEKDVKYLIASDDGRGFVVKSDDLVAQTKNGKQILNVKTPVEAAVCSLIDEKDDHVAVIGQNRKLLLFPLEELPEMSKGKGVILQRYKDGGVADVKTFNLEEGLSWELGDKTRTETDLMPWLGKRAQAGRMPPNGFPRSNKFSKDF
tara:strand:- start:3504 stop:5729 length:2226 start_codon:yes stop_codon:yes gene_type:complete